jgi:hypothetical protein
VKCRVSGAKGFARVGFKIRANPNNEQPLTNMVTMIAVPPDADGGSCTMSRKGGSWDELKRTLTWGMESLAPGEALEIQAQFPLVEENEKVPKFPVLVQCEQPLLFSGITVGTNEDDLQLKVNMAGRILHRKV